MDINDVSGWEAFEGKVGERKVSAEGPQEDLIKRIGLCLFYELADMDS